MEALTAVGSGFKTPKPTALELLARPVEFGPRARLQLDKLAHCSRCCGWVHPSNSYLCKRCGPREVRVRECGHCGGTVTSAAGFFCAACHFTGWWGEWK